MEIVNKIYTIYGGERYGNGYTFGNCIDHYKYSTGELGGIFEIILDHNGRYTESVNEMLIWNDDKCKWEFTDK